MKVRLGLPSHCCMFCGVPVVRLSRTVMVFSFVRRVSMRWLPMKPAPPVINVFFMGSVFSVR